MRMVKSPHAPTNGMLALLHDEMPSRCPAFDPNPSPKKEQLR
jgi:hypothetical protein